MANSFYWNEFIADMNSTIKDGDHVFDAGAGDGHWEKRITKTIQYTSMDLGVGDDKVDYSHLDIKGDLRKIPLADKSVDVIICIQVLEHLPEPWKVLEEFSRILKPGGFLFASCPQGEPQHQIPYDFFRYTIYGLKSLLNQFGFEVKWLKPQKGNFTKMANDLRHSSVLLKNDKSLFKSFLLKLIAKALNLLFKKEDEKYTTNTTGHFIKAQKQS